MKKFMFIFMIVLVGGILSGCGKKREKIIIYSSMEEHRNEDLKVELAKKFPGLKIEIEYYPTGNHAAKLKAEGLKTNADIVLGLETAHMEMLKDNFETLSDFDFSKFEDDVLIKEKKYFVWDRYSGAIIVNTKVLAEKGLSEPKSYTDLLKAEYKDLIMMPSPKTSGTGYQFLLQFVNILGEDEAFKFIDNLSKNVLQFSTSGSAPVNSLVRGEIAIGLGMTFHAVTELNKGAPLKLIYDEAGAPYNTSSAGVIKGRLARENVKAVFEYLFNDYIVRDKELFIPEKVFKDQAAITIPNFPNMVYGNMAGVYDINTKKRLLDKWKY